MLAIFVPCIAAPERKERSDLLNPRHPNGHNTFKWIFLRQTQRRRLLNSPRSIIIFSRSNIVIHLSLLINVVRCPHKRKDNILNPFLLYFSNPSTLYLRKFPIFIFLSQSYPEKGGAHPSMNPSVSTLQYWLVNHPKILHFSWTKGQTPGSTPQFLTLAVLAYLSLTFLLPRTPLPPLGPRILKPITSLHNLTLFLLSSIMALGCILSILSPHTPHLRHIICFPPQTPPSGPLFFWAYVFYLSKILEFIDTLLIILSNSLQRLTFLHVYHHATVVVMCYLWLHTSQSLFPVALVTNALVHVLMYYYYLSCAMGVRPKWKRLVTDCQIVQFVFSFCISVLMLYYHFTGLGCSGIWGWCFNAVFNASLLALFLDFHGKSYATKTTRSGHKDKRP